MMVGAHYGEHPATAGSGNKGYAAPEHLEALRVHGPSLWHRRSWRLPGTMDDDGRCRMVQRRRA